MPLEEVESLGLSVNSRIRVRETVSGEIIGKLGEELPIMLVKKTRVRDEHALMILRSPRQYRGDESYSKTASLVAKEIGKTGGFVIFVAGQIGICKLAHGYE